MYSMVFVWRWDSAPTIKGIMLHVFPCQSVSRSHNFCLPVVFGSVLLKLVRKGMPGHAKQIHAC